jgi:hypothetical protein
MPSNQQYAPGDTCPSCKINRLAKPGEVEFGDEPDVVRCGDCDVLFLLDARRDANLSVAHEIALELFTSCGGNMATNLRQYDAKGVYLSGWGYQPVVDRIAKRLDQFNQPETAEVSSS